MPTNMADTFGEMDLFLAIAKDCGIVFLLNQSQQSISPCLVSQPITAYVGHIPWQLPVNSLAVASAAPVGPSLFMSQISKECHNFTSAVLCVIFQSITGAMSTINPPVELEDASKQFRLEYIQNIATQPDFDYPEVTYCCASL